MGRLAGFRYREIVKRLKELGRQMVAGTFFSFFSPEIFLDGRL